jgi:hypothetical protein
MADAAVGRSIMSGGYSNRGCRRSPCISVADGELITVGDSEVGSARRQIVAWLDDGEQPTDGGDQARASAGFGAAQQGGH